MVRIFKFTKPITPAGVYFVKLELKKGDKIISENMYLRGANPRGTASCSY